MGIARREGPEPRLLSWSLRLRGGRFQAPTCKRRLKTRTTQSAGPPSWQSPIHWSAPVAPPLIWTVPNFHAATLNPTPVILQAFCGKLLGSQPGVLEAAPFAAEAFTLARTLLRRLHSALPAGCSVSESRLVIYPRPTQSAQ